MEEKNLICINCPLGCPLTVSMEDGEVKKVEGNTCPRGEAYAKKELTNPTRIVTSTVKVKGGRLARLPQEAAELLAAMAELHLVKKLDLELTKNREQLTKLQLEIGKTLTGDSIYSPEDLTQAIQTIKSRITEAETKLTALREEEAQKKQGIDLITPTYNQFKSWAEEFDTATLEQKKMIACHLFKRIEVGRDYKISVELNMSYQQFCSEWGDGSVLVTEAI